MAVNPFINASGRLRNGWWIAIFFVVLAALLVPLLLLSDGREVPIWRQAIIVVIASLICQALRRRPVGELLGRFNWKWPNDLLLGMSLGAALMLAPAILLWAFGSVRWEWNAGATAALSSSLVGFVAVAVTEEVLFRGFIFQRLIDGLGEWPAQLLIAALFLLTHIEAIRGTGAIGYLASVNIFIASLMFGFAFIRTRSLAMPIGLHFAANFVQGGVLGFGVSGGEAEGLLTPTLSGAEWLTGGAFGLEASVFGLASVTVLTLVLLGRRPKAVS